MEESIELKCIDNINLQLDKLLKETELKCNNTKTEEDCKKKDIYTSFIQISNNLNTFSNRGLEPVMKEYFKEILKTNSELIYFLKKHININIDDIHKLNRYDIFIIIIQYYLSNIKNDEQKNIILNCINYLTDYKNKKIMIDNISNNIYNQILNKIIKNNNNIPPTFEKNTISILVKLIETIVSDCIYIYKDNIYCNYQKKDDIFLNISEKIKKINCDDFKNINKALRELNNENFKHKNMELNDEKFKYSHIYIGLISFMNDYVYKNNMYILDDECLPTNDTNDTNDINTVKHENIDKLNKKINELKKNK